MFLSFSYIEALACLPPRGCIRGVCSRGMPTMRHWAKKKLNKALPLQTSFWSCSSFSNVQSSLAFILFLPVPFCKILVCQQCIKELGKVLHDYLLSEGVLIVLILSQHAKLTTFSTSSASTFLGKKKIFNLLPTLIVQIFSLVQFDMCFVYVLLWITWK